MSAAEARVFAALGDPVRLALVRALASGEGQSIARLSDGGLLTRQAVTKHLRVLERVTLVQSRRSGREMHFTLRPEALDSARAYLDTVSRQWDDALGRLKAFVEE